MDKPLAIDLFCGLGGWTDGLLAEGYDVIGFDIERHEYLAPETMPENDENGSKQMGAVPKRGWAAGRAVTLGLEGVNKQPLTRVLRYPAQLVIQDVTTLHGSQFNNVDLIVASPPCQEYSYMAMPWSLAKAKAKAIRSDESGERLVALNRLFNACFRIQKEASIAAGRHIPLLVENVRGAQDWVGRARWNFGSFYLWGDVPALMPMTLKASKVPGFRFDGSGKSFQSASVELTGVKAPGMNWSDQTKRGQDFTRIAGKFAMSEHGIKLPSENGRRTTLGNGVRFTSRDCGIEKAESVVAAALGTASEGRKGYAKILGQSEISRQFGSKSPQRKMASAMIAKIPLPLSRHIGAMFHPSKINPR